MLTDTIGPYIARMIEDEPLLRIGHIWYGDDTQTTVTGIFHFSNKQIQTIIPIRAESAISFSTSKAPIDSIQVELVINYNRFRSHIQKLAAMIKVSPILPVMNPVIAAVTQPILLNKRVYEIYGFNVTDLLKSGASMESIMRAYSSVPVQMSIDDINLKSINPREFSILVRMTRVLTANSYGDRVMYVKNMKDAVAQHDYMQSIANLGGDDPTTETIARMVGASNDQMKDMLSVLKALPQSVSGEDQSLLFEVHEVIDGDTVKGVIKRGEGVNDQEATVQLFGIDTPVNEEYIKSYDGGSGKILKEFVAQKYSREAKDTLVRLLYKGKKPDTPARITLSVIDKDTSRNIIAEITDEEDTNINLKMVELGYAYAFIESQSKGQDRIEKYFAAEESARAKGIGMWSSPNSMTPLEYRKEIRARAAMLFHKQ